EALQHRAGIDQLIAIQRPEPRNPPDPLAIAVAGLEARRAQADRERVEEQIAMDLFHAALDDEPADIATDHLARRDHRDVALERAGAGREPERLALVVR